MEKVISIEEVLESMEESFIKNVKPLWDEIDKYKVPNLRMIDIYDFTRDINQQQ